MTELPTGWKPAAILFDLDGTLVDSAPDLAAAADIMRTKRGLPPHGPDAYRHMTGAGARGLLEVAFGAYPGDAAFEVLKKEFLDHYESMLFEQTLPFQGVAELLSALHLRDIPWGIVTNKAERFTLPLVAHTPVFDNAAVVVSGDTTPHAKPHPAPLLEAARRLGVDPAKCIYVGDDERDVVAGKAAGMKTVGACYGYLGKQGQPVNWNADYLIDCPLDLLKWLALP
jgi:N-acetyl-D-muramate 6-phosphate phosphatase